ncbi:MAG: PEP-CTERM sorting domain-containing protein, partial [Proteobacteria bacterium]|nr:PEP-CTERM sorting domain-containing protein [Pseudomonadota bacterium]
PLLQIDETHYYYTADWVHMITESSQEIGPFTWHLEGIATIPEPGTIWLVGGTLLGLVGARYRNIGNARRQTTCLAPVKPE